MDVTLTLLGLPVEIITAIFGNLDTVSKLRLVRVCSALYNIFRLPFHVQLEARFELASRYRYICNSCYHYLTHCRCDQKKLVRCYAKCADHIYDRDCGNCEHCCGLWLPNGDEFVQFRNNIVYRGRICNLTRVFLPDDYEEEQYYVVNHPKHIGVIIRFNSNREIIQENEYCEHKIISNMYSTNCGPIHDDDNKPVRSYRFVKYFTPVDHTLSEDNVTDVRHTTETYFYHDGSSVMYVRVKNKLVRTIITKNNRRVSVVSENGDELIDNGPRHVEIDGPYCITW